MNKSVTFAMNLCGFIPERVQLFEKYGLPSLKANGIEPVVFEDKQKRNGPNPCWTAARQTWTWLAGQESEYVCCLADDFEYHPEMMLCIQRMILEHPGCAVSFFQPAIAGERFYKQEDLLMNYNVGDLLWGGSIVLPKKIVNKMIFWCDQISNVNSDDEKIAFALSIIGVPSYSSGQNYAYHYGAYLDSTISTDVKIPAEMVSKRAELRSGAARDSMQDIKYVYGSSVIKTMDVFA